MFQFRAKKSKILYCFLGGQESPEALQDLVEVVMTLKSAAERVTSQAIEVNKGPLSEQLTKYANILAAQGALSAALTYLGQSNEESINLLRERLQGALGGQASEAMNRKVSNQSASSRRSVGYQRPSWNSGGSGKNLNFRANDVKSLPAIFMVPI